MPQINEYTDYDEFRTPGLYSIINKSSGTFLGLSNSQSAPDAKIIGFKDHDKDSQKWQIADVGEKKFLIICKATGSYLRAIKDGDAVKAGVGRADHSDVHWKIVKPFSDEPEIIELHSVSLQGDVLELKNGSERDNIEVGAYAQNSARHGQQWLLKKIT